MAPQIVEYAIPTASSMPTSITQGPDGNLWFTEPGANKVADITPAGSITEFPLPSPSPATYYVHGGIAAGADGKLWFDFRQCNSHLTGGIFRECDPVVIDKITSNAAITGFQFSGSAFCSSVGRLTAGPDGNVWFTESSADQLGRITMTGAVTEFPVRTPNSSPGDITSGPGGTLWFTESSVNKIGRITP
jgi:virginiamycin B lyase